jgi:hypothetical protein
MDTHDDGNPYVSEEVHESQHTNLISVTVDRLDEGKRSGSNAVVANNSDEDTGPLPNTLPKSFFETKQAERKEDADSMNEKHKCEETTTPTTTRTHETRPPCSQRHSDFRFVSDSARRMHNTASADISQTS